MRRLPPHPRPLPHQGGGGGRGELRAGPRISLAVPSEALNRPLVGGSKIVNSSSVDDFRGGGCPRREPNCPRFPRARSSDTQRCTSTAVEDDVGSVAGAHGGGG